MGISPSSSHGRYHRENDVEAAGSAFAAVPATCSDSNAFAQD
jgi:hypothetical protein